MLNPKSLIVNHSQICRLVLRSVASHTVETGMNVAVLSSIATQLMTSDKVELAGERLPIRRIGHQRLKSVSFSIEGNQYMAIEQNADKPSRWGQLAREGHAVVQFKDVERNKFIAVAVDGEVKKYGAMAKRKHSGTQ